MVAALPFLTATIQEHEAHNSRINDQSATKKAGNSTSLKVPPPRTFGWANSASIKRNGRLEQGLSAHFWV
jgi:hypothetical protein